MTLADLLIEYADKKRDAISVIRTLSGMFNPDHAINILTIVNQITRVEQGDMDREMFKKLWIPKDENDL